MSNGSGTYFVGPPAKPAAAAAPPATAQAPPQVTGAAQQAPDAATLKYFVGPPVNPDKTMQQPTELVASPTTPHPPPKNRSSFLARWFPCICGSRPPPDEQ